MAKKKIVIYGGSFAGVAAAAKAAGQDLNDKYIESITIIVPDVSGMLGGLGTAGGQNYFDVGNEDYKDSRGGSFKWWCYDNLGKYYSVEAMSDLLKCDLEKYNEKREKIKIRYSYDVRDVTVDVLKKTITSVKISRIKRADSGFIVWNESYPVETITGDIFIDASDDGRLSRMADVESTVGRFDWPLAKLKINEKCCGVARQQAATLMFKVTGVVPGWASNDERDDGNPAFGEIGSGPCNFNEIHKDGSIQFAIKPYNAARNGSTSNEWWLNAMLIFNVDGRAYHRDKGTKYYPDCMLHGHLNVDEAWVAARDMIGSDEFILALKGLPGLESVKLVKADGRPVVGEVLYLRETIHNTRKVNSIDNDTENIDSIYAVTANEALISGRDSVNKAHCIGINIYPADINAYERSDLQNNTEEYIWHSQINRKLRPDIFLDENTSFDHPIYMPYEALTTPSVHNLLVPGEACSVSSMAWSKVRTLPNLTVLGDAAGLAAAYSAETSILPFNFKSEDISKIQAKFDSLGIVTKKPDER